MKTTKLLCLLLCVAMLLAMVTGCASKTTEPATEPAETVEEPAEESTESENSSITEISTIMADQQAAEAEAEDEGEAETQEEPDIVVEEDPIIGSGNVRQGPMWKSEEEATLSMFWGWPNVVSAFIPDPNDLPFLKYMEEATNVHLDLYVVADDVKTEKMNLLIAAGDLPDLVQGLVDNYTGGVEAALEEDVVVDIAPYIKEYCPNFCWALETYPLAYADILTIDGQIGSFYGVYNGLRPTENGHWIRQDWLDQLGLTAPETRDEFYDVIKAFKTEFDCSDAYCMMPSTGFGCVGNTYEHLDFYVDENGKVVHGIDDEEDQIKDMLQFVAKLYSEGLIGQDFISYVEMAVHEGVVETDNCGMFVQDVNYINRYDSSIKLTAIPTLVPEKGQKVDTIDDTQYLDGNTAISTNCQDIELACRYLDSWFTVEGSNLANYGVEGETYFINDDGYAQFTELITNNPDGIPEGIAKGVYAAATGCYMVDPVKLYANYTEQQRGASEIWNSIYNYVDSIPSQLPNDLDDYMTTEESTLAASLQTDINTAQEEIYFKLVMGVASFDDWDQYEQDIHSVGLDKLMELYQTVYDRYLTMQ